jgi:photoactive yellow protein
MALEKVRFGSKDIDNALSQLGNSEIDRLPFGAIKLDRNGIITFYSAAERHLTGRRPEEVLGKHFFLEVAPCTRRAIFHGRFVVGVQNDDLDAIFEYTFDYRMNPTRVTVHMKKAVGGGYWILVRRRRAL